MRCSSFDSHRTSCGAPRMKTETTAPARVNDPKKREIQRQAAIPARPYWYLAMPYILKLQIMAAKPSEDCQMTVRLECSSVRYQAAVSNRKPGFMEHSKKPCRARSAISCGQLLAALMQIRAVPAYCQIQFDSKREDGEKLTPAEHVKSQRRA